MKRFLRLLYPKSLVWRFLPHKNITKLNRSMESFLDYLLAFTDSVTWGEWDLDTSTSLDLWDAEFGFTNTLLTRSLRVERLKAARKFSGGQSARYLTDVLQASGFPLKVYDSWLPGSGGVPVDPSEYLRPNYDDPDPTLKKGYALVNILEEAKHNVIMQAGMSWAQCGNTQAVCGYREGFAITQKRYTLPVNPDYFRLFAYVGSTTGKFGDLVEIEADRRRELEELILSKFPANLWCGLFVKYVIK